MSNVGVAALRRSARFSRVYPTTLGTWTGPWPRRRGRASGRDALGTVGDLGGQGEGLLHLADGRAAGEEREEAVARGRGLHPGGGPVKGLRPGHGALPDDGVALREPSAAAVIRPTVPARKGRVVSSG